jgi:hypothetical protein
MTNLVAPAVESRYTTKKYNDKKKERKDAGVALAPKILEPKKLPILIFCCNPGNLPKYSTNAILSRAPILNQDTRLL